ncbi:glycosyltransferase family 4 protein [Nocardioides sp. CFH 31398]|uniref:glycosyltransferase family 4 protein n=1 Tax=Nocardioides sp. CFH 31398 TaxID=2919579 RepID=UPI001F056C6B|nr:glycosyltransferase family 4 protein [Nocardioides sp. CFH 31398]MCH1867668.1 glycosyltransferase family 4 protein [Nocardioides sp. CFH 31398]
MSSARRAPHVLVLVENLSVPLDRRVTQESRCLVEAGYDVTVICPQGTTQDTEPEAVVDGIRVLRYPLVAATGGASGYPREYAVALWHTVRLALKVRRRGPVDVVQACNPPDLLFLVALLLRPRGARFVFDHHDLVPELFLSRFSGSRRGLLYWATRLVERITFALADGVISTNESYREVAVRRGGVDPASVTVVRSGPDLARFTPMAPDPDLRRGKEHLLAYLGVMGPQDGVDYALRAVAALRDRGRDDFHCILMGAGDALDDLLELRAELGLDDVVEFPGRVSDDYVRRCLSTASVCLSPDPRNPLNDLSTMNKVVEYMAMGRPLVSFDLKEARVSAADAALYAADDDTTVFADAVERLLDDPALRESMGRRGRERVEHELSWETSRRHLLAFYARLLGDAAPRSGTGEHGRSA